MRYFALLILLWATPSFGAGSPSGVEGYWRTTTGSVVRVVPCGGDVCLTIAKLSANAPEKKDAQNPDAGLRGRALCGLAVGTGFHRDDATHLSGGHLYDPKSGHTYRGTIVAEGDRLKLHGYIGISLFGRTEVWVRVGAVGGCS